MQSDGLNHAFIHDLQFKLKGKLPGDQAHQLVLSYPRAHPTQARAMTPPPRESAVLMLLYQKSGEWYTVFIKRTQDQSVHSGQISFPGGKQEPLETLLGTALRETREELGVDPSAIEILGQLTEIYIPPSHFMVRPYIGWMPQTPEFHPSHSEVERVIEHPIHQLLQNGIILQKSIFIPRMNRNIQTMYFDLQGETLWGATAMIVQEVRSLLGFNQ